MAFLDSILAWLAGWILNYLAGKATTAIEDAAQDIAIDKARGETNAKNIQAYDDAKTRADKINAALNLLNGTN